MSSKQKQTKPLIIGASVAVTIVFILTCILGNLFILQPFIHPHKYTQLPYVTEDTLSFNGYLTWTLEQDRYSILNVDVYVTAKYKVFGITRYDNPQSINDIMYGDGSSIYSGFNYLKNFKYIYVKKYTHIKDFIETDLYQINNENDLYTILRVYPAFKAPYTMNALIDADGYPIIHGILTIRSIY